MDQIRTSERIPIRRTISRAGEVVGAFAGLEVVEGLSGRAGGQITPRRAIVTYMSSTPSHRHSGPSWAERRSLSNPETSTPNHLFQPVPSRSRLQSSDQRRCEEGRCRPPNQLSARRGAVIWTRSQHSRPAPSWRLAPTFMAKRLAMLGRRSAFRSAIRSLKAVRFSSLNGTALSSASPVGRRTAASPAAPGPLRLRRPGGGPQRGGTVAHVPSRNVSKRRGMFAPAALVQPQCHPLLFKRSAIDRSNGKMAGGRRHRDGASADDEGPGPSFDRNACMKLVV